MLDEDEARNGTEQQQQSQVLEPVEQESIVFHGQTIIAVRLADGRIAVVLRWICESLNLQPGGQVRRIERTTATASELVRVKVQTKGGRQTMPAITLRGFSPWVLGMNPNEVKSDNPEQDERIRALVVAYQEEAKDVLYEHFMNRQRPAAALPEARTTVVIAERATQREPARPQEPEPAASDEELTTYYENLALWALWKSHHHAQQWRGELEEWRGTIEARLDGEKAMLDLIPEIIERLGPETISVEQQRQVQAYTRQLHEASGKPYGTIYDELKTAFDRPRYQELRVAEWPQVVNWFKAQIQRARGKDR
jgi:hypothetical protein